jgi:hypothetical protein
MKLLGYILTFAIMFASILVLVVAVAVYGTQRNWQTAFNTLQTTYQTAQAANADLEARYLDQIAKLTAEQDAARQDVAKLETERDTMLRQNVAIQKELDQLQAASRESTALVAATEANNQKLTEEVTALRQSIRENQEARDKAFNDTLTATTALHVTAGELQQLQERNQQVVEQLAHAKAAAAAGGVDLNGEVVTPVRGVVNKTQRRNGVQLIEISVGADDGVKKGHTVEVFRGDRYLGRAEIISADPDRAVGRVMREFQQGQIQEGDNVATKLRVG